MRDAELDIRPIANLPGTLPNNILHNLILALEFRRKQLQVVVVNKFLAVAASLNASR